MYGLKTDWYEEPQARYFTLADYEAAEARWCPGCGDHAVLASIQKLCREEQLAPEKTVFVSGIGCSSRFPHYMKTYGFHGLHGRAFPVAEGVRARRPDVHLFVATGDGDCCSIGAGHWVHAVRYNMKMVVMLFDNNIYGLTKMQTSPTSKVGERTNTHPRGAIIEPLNPLQTTLSITNASFVAQTVDWNPAHLFATLQAAYAHPGFAFVRILQRCPHYTAHVFEQFQKNPDLLTLVEHEKGIQLDPAVRKIFKNTIQHDPSDIDEARKIADLDVREGKHPIGLLYHNPDAPRYDLATTEGIGTPRSEKIKAIHEELSRFRI